MISIVVPAYNHSSALPGLFDSLLAQTFGDWECIVVDDGSIDDTETVVRNYMDNLPHEQKQKFQYHKQANGGAPKARNAGAKLAKGEYLLFADADLILPFDWLGTMLSALQNDVQAAYAYSGLVFGKKLFAGREFGSEALRQNNYIHTSALIRTRDFPGFDESLKRFQDWDLWLTMLAQGKVGVFVPNILFTARVTRKGMSLWRPRIWYTLCALGQRVLGWAPINYRRYVEAQHIIHRKHQL